jgi:thiamine-phosphate pyrophosphorylase
MAFRFPGPLYPIADLDTSPQRAPLVVLEAALAAGIRLVQLRAKSLPTGVLVALARDAKAIAARYGGRLIINDRADVARLVDADGVHLGQDDLPAEAARALLGPHKIVGVSTHNLPQLAAAARAGIADYLAYGPVFATASKQRPDPVQGVAALSEARRLTRVPLVAIGGITAATIADVLATGVDAVAVIGAIAGATDPGAAARALQRAALVRARPRRRRS